MHERNLELAVSGGFGATVMVQTDGFRWIDSRCLDTALERSTDCCGPVVSYPSFKIGSNQSRASVLLVYRKTS
jgi:hypothetical protein